MFKLIKKIFIALFTGIVSASNHTKFVSLWNQKSMIQPYQFLLIYILMNTVKNFTTIHLRLN